MPLPAKQVKQLKKSLNRLKLSNNVKGILVDIANELNDIYVETIQTLQSELEELKKQVSEEVFEKPKKRKPKK